MEKLKKFLGQIVLLSALSLGLSGCGWIVAAGLGGILIGTANYLEVPCQNQEDPQGCLKARQEETQRAVERLTERFGLSSEAAASLLKMRNALLVVFGGEKDWDKLSAEQQQMVGQIVRKTTGLSLKSCYDVISAPWVWKDELAQAAEHLNTSEESLYVFVNHLRELTQQQ